MVCGYYVILQYITLAMSSFPFLRCGYMPKHLSWHRGNAKLKLQGYRQLAMATSPHCYIVLSWFPFSWYNDFEFPVIAMSRYTASQLHDCEIWLWFTSIAGISIFMVCDYYVILQYSKTQRIRSALNRRARLNQMQRLIPRPEPTHYD